MREKITALYIESLDPASQYYEEDIRNFALAIKDKPTDELKVMYKRMIAIMGRNPSVNREVDDEMERMGKAGMYNDKRMSAKLALD